MAGQHDNDNSDVAALPAAWSPSTAGPVELATLTSLTADTSWICVQAKTRYHAAASSYLQQQMAYT